MNIPHSINIERLKEVSEIWNKFIDHKSQIAISFIVGISSLALLVFLFKTSSSTPLIPIFVIFIFGIFFIFNGLLCIKETKKSKIKLDSYSKSEIVTLENIVEHLNKIKPNSLKNSFQFFNTEGSGKGRRYFTWVVFLDGKYLYILRKPREIHFCHINSFSIEQKGPVLFSNAVLADFHINEKTISGTIYPEDYEKYTEWKQFSPISASASISPSAPDSEQDDEIYKGDF